MNNLEERFQWLSSPQVCQFLMRTLAFGVEGDYLSGIRIAEERIR